MKSIVLFLTLNSFLLVSSYTLKVQRETLNFHSNNPQNFQKFLSLFNLDQTPKLSLEAENQILANYYQKFDKDPSRFTKERRQIILENYQKVLEHNEKFQRGETLFKMELNHFSDFTDDELKGRLMREVWVPENDTYEEPARNRFVSVPSSWNWVEKSGVVQPVQDQGQCGSCYAFASIGAIEGSMCIHQNQCTKLSEQEAMECTRGCEGGNYAQVFQYTQRKGGCASESSYPYKGRVQQSCSAHGARVPHSKVKKFQVLSRNAGQQKNSLYQNGPFYVAMEIYHSFYSYHSGVFNDCNGSSNGYHAVLVVGYGEDNGTPYWIVKNSWATHWGEQGFFKIKRGSNCAKMESLSPAFPVV